MTNSEFLRVQMEVLDAVDYFCREEGIAYSIADGTLLGAVRHKGFIPWDDDIDIMMIRSEYDKFILSFPDTYKGHYELRCLERTKNHHHAHANVFDNRTVLIENANVDPTGVDIGIFPIDDVPDGNGFFGWSGYRKLLYISKMLPAIKLIKNGNYKRLMHNIILFFAKIILCPFSVSFLSKIHDKVAKINNGKNHNRCYECSFGVYGNDPFSKSIFDSYRDYIFEDRKYRGILDFDEFLSKTYGDYMTPPPIEQQISHHSAKAYWK